MILKVLMAFITNPQTLLAILKDFGKVLALILRWYIRKEAEAIARKKEDAAREKDQGGASKESDKIGNGTDKARDDIDDMLK